MTKWYGNIDLQGNQLINVVLESLAADPPPAVGRVYYNTASQTLRVSDGTTWLTGGLPPGSVIPVGGTTGQILTKASDSDRDLTWSTPVAPTTTVALPLDTLTDWTIESGTWAIVGGVLQLSTAGQTTTRVIRLNQRVNTSMCVVSVEARVVSGSGSNQRFSVGIAEPANATGGWPIAHFTSTDNGVTWRTQADQKDTTGRGFSAVISGLTGYGTWHTFKILFVGDTMSVYVNGDLTGNFTNANATANSQENRWLALAGYNSVSEFRNLQVWGAEQFLGGVL